MDARRLAGGFIEFGPLFKDMFFAAAIGTFFCSVFEYFLFNYIDPDLKVFFADSMRSILEERGKEGNALYKLSLEQIENGQYFSVGSRVIDFVRKLIIPCATMSSIFALIMKRKKSIST